MISLLHKDGMSSRETAVELNEVLHRLQTLYGMGGRHMEPIAQLEDRCENI